MPRVGFRHTEEVRQRMSASHKGVPLSPQHRAALSAASVPNPLSVEARARKSAKVSASKLGNQYFRGRKHSPKALAKMSAAKAGNRNGATPCSDEAKAKISAALTGVPFTRTHRVALSHGHLVNVSQGYAYLKLLGSWKLAHRLAWTFYHGPIPEGEVVCPTNGDPLDCDEGNLEAMTLRDHTRFHRQGALSDA